MALRYNDAWSENMLNKVCCIQYTCAVVMMIGTGNAGGGEYLFSKFTSDLLFFLLNLSAKEALTV